MIGFLVGVSWRVSSSFSRDNGEDLDSSGLRLASVGAVLACEADIEFEALNDEFGEDSGEDVVSGKVSLFRKCPGIGVGLSSMAKSV